MFSSRIAAILVAVALLAALAACGGDKSAKAAPDFAMFAYQGSDRLGGEQLSFRDVVSKGQPVVLNFWGGTCPPCRAEMPDIERVHQKYKDRVLFLGLDVGPFLLLGSQDEGRALLQELEVTYPAAGTESREVIEDYEVIGLPKTVFIRPDGSIQRDWQGILTEKRLGELVEELIRAS